MSARELDPAVWAAAFGTTYATQAEAVRLADSGWINIERCKQVADDAVLSLHPEGFDGKAARGASYTPGEVINMTRRGADAARHMLTHAIGWPQHEANGWGLDTIGGHLPDSPCWIRVMNVPPHREPGWTVDREIQRFTRWLATLGYAIERLPSASIEPIFRLVPARVIPDASAG